MRLQHSFTVGAAPDQAWTVLRDLGAIARCMPNSTIETADADTAAGSLKVKLGPLNLTYRGDVRLVGSDESTRTATLQAQGTDPRNGSATATVTVALDGDGGHTTVALTTDLEVTGKPAQFGSGVMHDVGTKLVGQFAENLASVVSDSAAAASGPTIDEPIDEPTGDEPTSDEATGDGAPAGDTSPPVVSSAPQPVDPDGPAAPAPGRPQPTGQASGVPSFAVPDGLPSSDDSADEPSSNGHGSAVPAAVADAAGDAAVSLVQSARPAIVKGLAPVALAVVFVLGAARRRRRR